MIQYYHQSETMFTISVRHEQWTQQITYDGDTKNLFLFYNGHNFTLMEFMECSWQVKSYALNLMSNFLSYVYMMPHIPHILEW